MKQTVAPVMASRTRQKIMSLLYSAPQGPTQLARTLGLSRPYISNHLAVLKSHRLVTLGRSGRKAVYDVEAETRVAMQHALSGVLSRPGAARFADSQSPNELKRPDKP